MQPKNTLCLWYDGTALEAAQFYAATFPDSAVGAIHRAPGDYPSGRQGDVLTVEFTVMGLPCLGLNGGPAFRHSEAFSFQVATDDQADLHARGVERVDGGLQGSGRTAGDDQLAARFDPLGERRLLCAVQLAGVDVVQD